MKVTLIGYEKAAHILKAGESTVRRAVSKGNLTKVEVSGKIQQVIEEQVRLFENESQIRKSLLKSDKLKTWEAYKAVAENYTAYKNQTTQNLPSSVSFQPATSTSLLDTLIMSEEDYNSIMRGLDVLERIGQLLSINVKENSKKNTPLPPRNKDELAERLEQLSKQISDNAKDENFNRVVDFLEQLSNQGEGIPIFPGYTLPIIPYINGLILRNMIKQSSQTSEETEPVGISK